MIKQEPKRATWRLRILVTFGVIAGIVISQCLRSCSSSLPPTVRPYVRQADERSHDAVDESLAELQAFFEQAKANVPPFVDVAVGWGSKWRLIADYVVPKGGAVINPTIGPSVRIGQEFRHEKYIRTKFNEMIFSDQQLAKVVEDTIANFFKRLESIDNKMLVDIRADLPDLAVGSALQTLDERHLMETYRETIEKVQRQSTNKIGGEIGAEIASFIAGEVLASIAVRLAVSGGILGTGAASSWATLGIGVVVGIIVDYIVAKVWDWYADPKGTLVTEMVSSINGIQTLLIDGASATDSAEAVVGLRERLTSYAMERQKLRETTIHQLLKPSTR
ncbi:MAG: hypothetical protein ACRCUY_03305 [Thermoguttaceae bacterium]